jgi:hypothetical protein
VARTCRHARLAAPSASARPLVAHWTSEGSPWSGLVRVAGEADQNGTGLWVGHDSELLEQTQLSFAVSCAYFNTTEGYNAAGAMHRNR